MKYVHQTDPRIRKTEEDIVGPGPTCSDVVQMGSLFPCFFTWHHPVPPPPLLDAHINKVTKYFVESSARLSTQSLLEYSILLSVVSL